jgi:periplasmic copper chaperone A
MKKLIALAALLPAAAGAHVVFDQPQATAGGYYTGFLRVTHGCGDSPTVSVRVDIPDGVVSARPQPKPGWTLRIEREPLASPIKGEGDAAITTRVTAITWTGQLPPDEFDQFGLSLKLPDAAGPLYFPTTQRCEAGVNAWTAIPASPEQWHATPFPAPMLKAKSMATDHHM